MLKYFEADILFAFALKIQAALDSDLLPNEQSVLCEAYIFETFIAGLIIPMLFAAIWMWKCPVSSHCLLKP